MNAPELELTADAGLEALRAHVVEKAIEARATHGPDLGADSMRTLIADTRVVRFKTRLEFDAQPLRPGEFGWARPVGDRPNAGFRLVLHPDLESRPEDWPLCAAYHLVSINYLDVATSAEAEAFGAALFGLTVDAYYERLCAIADSLPNALGAGGYQMPGELPVSGDEPVSDATPEGAEPIDAVALFLAPHLPAPAGCGESGCGCAE